MCEFNFSQSFIKTHIKLFHGEYLMLKCYKLISGNSLLCILRGVTFTFTSIKRNISFLMKSLYLHKWRHILSYPINRKLIKWGSISFHLFKNLSLKESEWKSFYIPLWKKDDRNTAEFFEWNTFCSIQFRWTYSIM